MNSSRTMRPCTAFIACVCSLTQASLWMGGTFGADDTFFEDQSFNRDRDSLWIEGVTKRVFFGYLFEQALLRCSVAMEWSWDDFSRQLGRPQSNRDASYSLSRDWSWIIRPGVRFGDGFVYTLFSTEHAEIKDSLSGAQGMHSQSVNLFPYTHTGAGLSFAVAPQTELMAEVRLSQNTSKKLLSYILDKTFSEVSEGDYTIRNTQLMLGLSYAL